jgi:[NiFe] hydrogenase diaphorase moiety small subunit
MSEDTLTIFIDDQPVAAREGQTIIEAADEAGIYIPRLCYHPDLPPGGHCRLCTVKINGRATNSCTYPVSEGLIIENDTEELNALRRNLIEMLFVEGNHYCPMCEASGHCELQAMAYRLGIAAKTMPYLTRPKEIDATNKDVYLDRDRCILCGRCVRASKHVDGKCALAFEGRGITKRVAADSKDGLGGTDLSSEDKAAHICPTGSLVVKREGFQTPVGRRPYDHEPIGTDIERQKAEQPVV